MICNRIKQFREYNELEPYYLAEILGITLEKYENFENGTETPTIDIIHALSRCYKVTVDEFYGYSPRLMLHNKTEVAYNKEDDEVSQNLLKMSDLSWDEKKLILFYRMNDNKEEIIKSILQQEKNDTER